MSFVKDKLKFKIWLIKTFGSFVFEFPKKSKLGWKEHLAEISSFQKIASLQDVSRGKISFSRKRSWAWSAFIMFDLAIFFRFFLSFCINKTFSSHICFILQQTVSCAQQVQNHQAYNTGSDWKQDHSTFRTEKEKNCSILVSDFRQQLACPMPAARVDLRPLV